MECVTMESREFKPVKTTFILPPIMGMLTFCAVLSLVIAVVAVASGTLPLLIFAGVPWLIIVAPTTYNQFVAYRKERYEVHSDRLVAHRGGMLSDGRTELDIRNITHVRLRLPWLRHKFFKVGDVRVESAGSSASEITFRSILEPEAVYEEVQELMRQNGYSLKRTEELHMESPGTVGALTVVGQRIIGGIASIFFLLFFIGSGVVGLQSQSGILGILAAVAGLAFGSLMVISAIAGIVVTYLDITRRTYTVHNDAVTYTEGFLTRDNAFIPYENIADAATNRTVVDQVLGLYDVKVSCQGSGSEIYFRRLSNGPALQEAIATLVASAGNAARVKKKTQKATLAEKAETEGAPDSGIIGKPGAKPPQSRTLVDPDEAWTTTFNMNMMRTLVPLLSIIWTGPAFLIAAVAMAIKVSKTTFTIGTDSMASTYAFLGAKHQEYAYDKVTGVQITRNPLDTLFKTVTVQIWSIGSPQPLVLSNIIEEELDLPALLRQCGIPSDEPVQGELKQSLGPTVWLIQNVFGLVFLGVLAFVCLILAVAVKWPFLLLIPVLLLLPIPAAIAAAVRTGRQRLTFHAEHMEAQTGIFFRQHIHVRYDNIKKVESTRIPLTEQGTFKVYVAGERLIQQQNQQNNAAGGLKMPYTLQGLYIQGIDAKVDAMDALMLGLIEPAEIDGVHEQGDDIITTSHPAFANDVVVLVIIGILFFPLLVLVPITIWQVKMRRYEIETDRVVVRSGILFKSSMSVLYNRIDSIQQNQGALGKAFGNGRVTILTAGSSMPDLVVANVPDYQEVYDTVREYYGRVGR
ncbi:MAG: membrane protein YdbS with pleckstrin-like domain [Myxococcota bacterium]|jgi:membrane protein YdbS with pleckstrin-like domain